MITRRSVIDQHQGTHPGTGLRRVACWSGASDHDTSTPPAKIARRVRVWLHEAGLSPADRSEL